MYIRVYIYNYIYNICMYTTFHYSEDFTVKPTTVDY